MAKSIATFVEKKLLSVFIIALLMTFFIIFVMRCALRSGMRKIGIKSNESNEYL